MFSHLLVNESNIKSVAQEPLRFGADVNVWVLIERMPN
ncbi:hypothetical protein F383_10004 [Gossypium arboreum]|uniref:Uncharacterized protein n=1 Tax=Gossypium arboreum TaxID=29729 RepID=A0A0B0NKP8_GOSAR|nr:hypothetical protein F383_10004 [Gossypium arboreum]